MQASPRAVTITRSFVQNFNLQPQDNHCGKYFFSMILARPEQWHECGGLRKAAGKKALLVTQKVVQSSDERHVKCN